MPPTVYRIIEVLSSLVTHLPIGTNLGMVHLLWTIVTGRLLASRGAIIPALAASGLSEDAVRRAWATLTYGSWRVGALLQPWQQLVKQENRWQAHQHGAYRPVAVDLVGYFRPRLKDCATKHYQSQAGKALPAISLGMIAAIGTVDEQTVPLLRHVVRQPAATTSEKALILATLRQAGQCLQPNEVLLADRGFPLKTVRAAGVPRFVLRVATNFTARRSTPPAYCGHGPRPKRGEVVRPLPRRYRTNTRAATPADRSETWAVADRAVRADFWDQLVVPQPELKEPEPLMCVAIHDPLYQTPLLLVTNLSLTGTQLCAAYLDRWPVEQIPLTAKQLLGAARQFVFAPETRHRLPELSLLAGNVAQYVAATLPAQPTGFWDRRPLPTAGRLRRTLARLDYPNSLPLPEQIREKRSVTAHLPKGLAANRRVAGQSRQPRHRAAYSAATC